MKFSLASAANLNHLVLAGLLGTIGASAMAQTAATPPAAASPAPYAAGQPAGSPSDHMGRMDHHDPAKMQAMMARRQTEMKAKLKITPAQEGAWTTFTASMQPPAHGARPTPEQRTEFDKLTTPQRIDKMREMRTQRMTEMNAAMDKRGEATKTFYAVLTAEQQKVFDAEHKKHEQKSPGENHHGYGSAGPNKS